MMYDLDKNDFVDDTYASLSPDCNKDEKKSLRAQMDMRELDLEEIDLSLEDLIEFGNWYYTDN